MLHSLTERLWNSLLILSLDLVSLSGAVFIPFPQASTGKITRSS